METAMIILLGLAWFGIVKKRLSNHTRPTWLRHFEGRRKILGMVAAVIGFVILLNPELMALGILGDAAFFDILVVAIGLQVHMDTTRIFRMFVDALFSVGRWLGTPSPRLACLATFAAITISCGVAACQRILGRVLA